LKNGLQITEFKEGIIPFALRNGIALVLDEYDAIKTDVSFVIQRLLEEEGKFSLLEENEIISPHPNFRLFATSNTLGAGDDLGIYHGTNLINQAQMDRWNIVASLNYLDQQQELVILLKKLPKNLNKFTITEEYLYKFTSLEYLDCSRYKNIDESKEFIIIPLYFIFRTCIPPSNKCIF
jgi:cobaltochelatase CobS